MRPNRISIIVLVGALLLQSHEGMTDDTDIYLTPANVSRDDAPNVLIIFDNSSSMTGEYITTAAAYDATHTYTGPYDNTKVYWSTTGAPPASDTTQWFMAANNLCNSSLTNLGSTAAATGKYGGDRIAYWKIDPNNASQGRWESIVADSAINATMEIECKADRPNAEKPLAGGGKYAKRGTNNAYIPKTSRYTNASNQEVSWTNFTSPTFYSGNYSNYRADSATQSQTRMEVAKRVVKSFIDTNQNIRLGLMVFNQNLPAGSKNGGYLAMKIDNMTDERRTQMKTTIDSINPNPYGPVCDPAPGCTGPYTGTPLAETMWEAYQYLAGNPVYYGDDDSPTPVRDTSAEQDVSGTRTYISPYSYSCQQAYIIYITDGNPWQTDDTHADTAIGNLSGIGNFNSAYTNGKSSRLDELSRWLYDNDLCNSQNCSLTGTQRAITYTVAFALGTDTDSVAGKQLLVDAANNGHGKSYTANDSAGLSTALQSAFVDIQTTTSSFAAPTLSVNAFNKLFNRNEVYFALFKPSSTTRWDGNVKKFTLCDTGDTGCTYGEIIDQNKKPAIDPVTLRVKDEACSIWTLTCSGTTGDGGTVTAGGAGAMIPAPDARNSLYTYLGAYPLTGSVALSTYPVNPVSGNTLYDAAVADPSVLGITTVTSGSVLADRQAEVNKLMQWMRGRDSYDNNKDNSTTDKRWALGDPLHSRPVAVTYGALSCTAVDAALGNCTFGKPDPNKPIIKLFVGTNDGVVRMINDANGEEEWAFVPNEMLANQFSIAQDADGTHPYGIDGTPTFWIQDKSRDTSNNVVDIPDGVINPADGDFIYMFIGMRRGGKNIYAFDVTPNSTLANTDSGNIAPKLLWVIRGGVDADYAKLGQTWSRPLVARVRFACTGQTCTEGDNEAKTVLLFGGGYDTNQDGQIHPGPDGTGNAIFMADPLTGSRIWWASGTGSGATKELAGMSYSIPSDLALMDANADGEIDRIYVGDTGGQLWRIDLSPTIKTNNNGNPATTGYRLADVGCPSGSRSGSPECSGTAVQDRRKFFYPPDVAQMLDYNFFSTTSKYDLVVIESGDREDPTDRLTEGLTTAVEAVHNRIYAFRDVNIDPGPPATIPTTAIMDVDLYPATSNKLQDPNSSDYQDALTAIKGKKGWYVDLQEATNQSAPQCEVGTTCTKWVGEKGLARIVVFGGVVFATTYVPASEQTAQLTCAKDEGLGRLYALNALNAAAVYETTGDNSLTSADRIFNLGGGIPSELVTVIREGGVTGLVGVSGGAARPGIDSKLPRITTYWYQE